MANPSKRTGRVHRSGGSERPALEWRNVSLRLGTFSISDADLSIRPGEWVSLVGPTGAGKTLLLEVVAGFHDPDEGSVFANGIEISRLPPEMRGIAYVPQDDLLFPHLNVRKNLLFGASKRRIDTASLMLELGRVAEQLEITHLLHRDVRTISGGEGQRVATGRALLSGRPTLLLDECTSALDHDTRERIGEFLLRERERRGLSVVQVTHDGSEARRLSDRIIGVENGRITGPICTCPKPATTTREVLERVIPPLSTPLQTSKGRSRS